MGIEQNCTEETSQRGETLATLRPILTRPRIETQTSPPMPVSLSTNADRSLKYKIKRAY